MYFPLSLPKLLPDFNVFTEFGSFKLTDISYRWRFSFVSFACIVLSFFAFRSLHFFRVIGSFVSCIVHFVYRSFRVSFVSCNVRFVNRSFRVSFVSCIVRFVCQFMYTFQFFSS